MRELLRDLAPVLVMLLMTGMRYARRYRFWKSVVAVARRIVEDADNPITDPRIAAEQALLEAQRAQLSAIERSIASGGNGFRNGH